ncbi:MAG: A/G-specific adenine glycosylase [Ilumatobacteraceae bacterium]
MLDWGESRLRDLPWRQTRDPWAVLVAEIMLQQTQADRVVPRWREFLADYPTPVACADAPLGDVLRAWQGLGYPRRARNLHSTAVVVRDVHGGRLPDRIDELLELPGIGPYTSRAVLAFAFEHDVAVVDTNIARVLARVTGQRLVPKQVQAVADHLVPHGHGWLWNQALMDLGAGCCRPSPSCDPCPLRTSCEWHGRGHPDPDPAVGSAGVSTRQPPFEGSARQARGRVLRELGDGPRPGEILDRAIVESLVADGLVVEHADGTVSLP